MSAFVDALFGDMPVINEPYRPVAPDKWAASDGAFDLRDASVPIKVHPSLNMSTPPWFCLSYNKNKLGPTSLPDSHALVWAELQHILVRAMPQDS